MISSNSGSVGRMVLHKAEWLVPVNRPPIQDGAVLVSGNAIMEVSGYKDLKPFISGHVRTVDHGLAALMPCLVNAHTHLELSFMEGKIPLPQDGFAQWLENLFSLRALATQQEQLDGLLLGKKQLIDGGTGLYADTYNEPGLVAEDEFPARHAFQEILGFNEYDLESAVGSFSFRAAANNDYMISLAVHACYSTSASLIQRAKIWCRDHHLPFSIHVAEHADEIEFMQNGGGYCRELLDRLGKWVPGWKAPSSTPLQYLDSLGILDRETLLVHAVHMQQSDWEIVSKRHCAICFCPRSNYNLNVGRPDIEKTRQYGILTCLGTDSLASNKDLHLFAEADYLLNHYPGVSPETVIFMMTLGGAQALKQSHRFGSLAPGGHSTFLSVNLSRPTALSQLSETLICQGSKGEWKWVNYTRNN